MFGYHEVDEYYDWLLRIIRTDTPPYDNYINLLQLLSRIPFYWSLRLDESRAVEGLMLRDNFAEDFRLDYGFWKGVLPENASVLEILIALACRCEDSLMHDDDLGDRTYIWFWKMIENLGLLPCTDQYWEISMDEFVHHTIDVFLSRRYRKDGIGSIFQTNNPRIDMRNTDLWYQMNHYIDENYQF